MTTIGQLAASPTNYTPEDADDVYSHLKAIDAVLARRVGQIVAWPTENLPSYLLECDGAWLNKETYSQLYAQIGGIYGSDETRFRLPSLNMGYFPMVQDNGKGQDSLAGSRTDRGDGTTGDNVGTYYVDREDSHSHGINLTTNTVTGGGGGRCTGTGTSSWTPYNGGNEFRPISISATYCIIWGTG